MSAAGHDRDAPMVRLALFAAMAAGVGSAPTPPDPRLASLAAQVPPELVAEGRALSTRADAVSREWGGLGGAGRGNTSLTDSGARAMAALGQTDRLLAEGEAFNARFLEWLSGRGLAVRSLLQQMAGIRSLRGRLAVIRALTGRGAPPAELAAHFRSTDLEFGALRPATFLASSPRGPMSNDAANDAGHVLEERPAPPAGGAAYLEGWQ